MTNSHQPQQDPGVDINGVSGDFSVGGDVVGRDKVVSIGNLTVQQFVTGEWPLEQQLVFFVRQIGLTSAPPSFAASQFEAYCGAWRSLQKVRVTGEELWDRATAERLVAFSEALKQANLVIGEGEVFFEPNDWNDLRRLLGALGWFRRGKGNIVAMRSIVSGESEADYYSQRLPLLQAQIEENRRYKEEYEALITRIRDSFRIRLQNILR